MDLEVAYNNVSYARQSTNITIRDPGPLFPWERFGRQVGRRTSAIVYRASDTSSNEPSCAKSLINSYYLI